MITGVHFLLNYACTYECEHCFVYSSPRSPGVFTMQQINQVLDELDKTGTVKKVYFEGGEPFLYYQLMLAAIKEVRRRGYMAGIVTNAYWATSEEDARIWLEPLQVLGIADLSLSDDRFHYEDAAKSLAQNAFTAAVESGIPVKILRTEPPTIGPDPKTGASMICGDTMFRGRAAEKLLSGLPLRPYQEFNSCPHEDLVNPTRVHLDPYGNVQVCQGINIGNMYQTPLSEILLNYDCRANPVCRYLAEGGPVRLAQAYGIEPQPAYADACHGCYDLRKKLLSRYPEYLTPRQVYGLPPE